MMIDDLVYVFTVILLLWSLVCIYQGGRLRSKTHRLAWGLAGLALDFFIGGISMSISQPHPWAFLITQGSIYEWGHAFGGGCLMLLVLLLAAQMFLGFAREIERTNED